MFVYCCGVFVLSPKSCFFFLATVLTDSPRYFASAGIFKTRPEVLSGDALALPVISATISFTFWWTFTPWAFISDFENPWASNASTILSSALDLLLLLLII